MTGHACLYIIDRGSSTTGETAQTKLEDLRKSKRNDPFLSGHARQAKLSFSSKDDLKLALEVYHAGFVRLFETYQRCEPSGIISFAGNGWEEEQARQLAAALEFAAQKCKMLPTSRPLALILDGNHFGETGQRLIKQALKFSKIFAGVRF